MTFDFLRNRIWGLHQLEIKMKRNRHIEKKSLWLTNQKKVSLFLTELVK